MTEEQKVFRWSFSQWESYQSCAARWKYRNILKLPGKPPGPAAARGLEIHKSIEDYIQGQGSREVLHPAISEKYVPVFDEYRLHENGDRHVEMRLAFDLEWMTCGPRDPQASMIGVLDAVRHCNDRVVRIGEWKSGKPKDTHRDQRTLYAAFGLIKYKAPEVEVTTYYVEDTAPPARLKVTAEALPKVISIWDERRRLMTSDQFCAPNPGLHCRWCDYAKAAGGPCQF
jgi:CRISPR/Cas system-associated exonuclease Cas4 (RecB family)